MDLHVQGLDLLKRKTEIQHGEHSYQTYPMYSP